MFIGDAVMEATKQAKRSKHVKNLIEQDQESDDLPLPFTAENGDCKPFEDEDS